VAAHKKNPSSELSIHGQERVDATVRLCRMNLAIHGLEGDIRHANSYYEDPHHSTGLFHFVAANPPFNVNEVDKERLAAEVGPGRRYPFGLPRTDNANYLWIQEFYSALNEQGRAGFVMANSASDARGSEQEIRRQLIESRSVDVMVAVGPNFFYTVTLPCTLWFFDKSKSRSSRREEAQTKSGKGSQSLVTSAATSGVDRADTVLFIDARHIYRQVDRAHRDWTETQISFLANLVRLYRGEAPDFTLGGDAARAKLEEVFGERDRPGCTGSASRRTDSGKRVSRETRDTAGKTPALPIQYRAVPGLCRAATLKEIEAQGWSLNPGRYVGVAPGEAVSDEDFKEQLETLNEELESLNAQARELEATIAKNAAEILEA
jgi:type I restriction enzyme M protein